MSVIIYQFDDAVVILRIGVAHPTALYHLALTDRKLHRLDAVALQVVSRKDDRVRLGIVFTLEYTMLHFLALCLVCFQRVQYGNLNVVVADDDTEEARLVLIEVRFVLLGSL